MLAAAGCKVAYPRTACPVVRVAEHGHRGPGRRRTASRWSDVGDDQVLVHADGAGRLRRPRQTTSSRRQRPAGRRRGRREESCGAATTATTPLRRRDRDDVGCMRNPPTCSYSTVVLRAPGMHRLTRPVSRGWDRLLGLRAIGSVVEHSLHTRGVTGSNPVSPTEVVPPCCREAASRQGEDRWPQPPWTSWAATARSWWPASTASSATCRPPSRTPTSSRRSRSTPPRAWPSCVTPRRTCWRRRCRTPFPTRSWASGRRSRTASTTTSTSRRPSPRRTSPRSRSGWWRSSSPASGSSAASSSEDEAVRELADEPYKLRLIGSEGGADVMEVGGAELTIYDNLDAKTGERCWGDLCRGPHVPDTRYIPQNAVKLMRTAAAYWLGDQKQRAAAARLRHRLAVEGRAPCPPDLPRGGRAARPPPAGRRARPVLVPRADRIRARGLPPQGRRRPARHGGLLAARARGGRLRVRQQPAHHQGRPVRAVRAPRLVRRRHVPPDAAGRRGGRRRRGAQAGRRLLPQADELPDAQPHLRRQGTLVPRAAAAAVRVRHRVPLREVGRRPGADPGARLHAGRRAHLLHQGADAGGAGPAAHVRARPPARLRSGRLLPRALDPRPRQVGRHRRGLGGGDARPCAWPPRSRSSNS